MMTTSIHYPIVALYVEPRFLLHRIRKTHYESHLDKLQLRIQIQITIHQQHLAFYSEKVIEKGGQNHGAEGQKE